MAAPTNACFKVKRSQGRIVSLRLTRAVALPPSSQGVRKTGNSYSGLRPVMTRSRTTTMAITSRT